MSVLTDEQVRAKLADLPGWRAEGTAIVKEFAFGDFMGSIGYINRLAEVAEDANHHPDLSVSWNRVIVQWSSHEKGGVTEFDLEMAAKSDNLA
ncbi:MAG: 4a-hydroxytetrahydrobiopterin dehydratase [Thermoleophilia bacterium]|nr:4a-hydroxytetrahydrobiopterin dehydratase [Thermoleophilia bacterium]MDH3724503.1 4a-hydroxytetrahydrobiopterin dehydratase [Thermoleophilia bacterium]